MVGHAPCWVGDLQVSVPVRLGATAATYAEAKVRSLGRYAPEPVLHARVRLTVHADPAVANPVIAQGNLDLNGRLLRAQVAAPTASEAVDALHDRLRRRLDRMARNWEARRGGQPTLQPHEWRHGSGPAHRPAYFRCHLVCGRGPPVRAAGGGHDGALLCGGVGDDYAAFRAFAEDFPQAAILLVDTYDTVEGVQAAIEVGRRPGSPTVLGIRLDSGDLLALARQARRMLDAAGLATARIVASGGLDEYSIAELVMRAAPIDAFGVGTRMGVSADTPSLDSAYKLVQYGHRPVMKFSPGKQTAPGAKQVYRGRSWRADVLALRDEPAPAGYQPLLVPVMRHGRRVTCVDTVYDARRRFEADLAWLPDWPRQVWHPTPLRVRPSPRLTELTQLLHPSGQPRRIRPPSHPAAAHSPGTPALSGVRRRPPARL
jgi:ribosome-associated translation inhibitor RaiA